MCLEGRGEPGPLPARVPLEPQPASFSAQDEAGALPYEGALATPGPTLVKVNNCPWRSRHVRKEKCGPHSHCVPGCLCRARYDQISDATASTRWSSRVCVGNGRSGRGGSDKAPVQQVCRVDVDKYERAWASGLGIYVWWSTSEMSRRGGEGLRCATLRWSVRPPFVVRVLLRPCFSQ